MIEACKKKAINEDVLLRLLNYYAGKGRHDATGKYAIEPEIINEIWRWANLYLYGGTRSEKAVAFARSVEQLVHKNNITLSREAENELLSYHLHGKSRARRRAIESK